MKKKLAFRFDIDTLKCIKYGVPKLVNISKNNDVRFTFFMNFGKSIDRREAFKNRSKSFDNVSNKISTKKKLGFVNYILTIFVNPKLDIYRDEIELLVNSGNEIGLHGGYNHGTWQLHGEEFDFSTIQQEINFGLKKGKKYGITFHGFSSPGMTSNKFLPEVLKMNNFKYISDTYTFKNQSNDLEKKKFLNNIKNLNVNLSGEKGVGYFEYHLSKKQTPKKIKEALLVEVLNSDEETLIIYDHPLIIQFVENEFVDLIKELKKNNVEIVTLSELL
tara:strand:+ start:310 stop:1134 length:825 start_codon:yes stop_codon:yes gene_type:complete